MGRVGTSNFRIVVAIALAACLAGCGILPRVAQQTTAAAIAPVATTARIVSRDLVAVSKNIAASSAATARTARQVSASAAQARAASRAAEQQRAQVVRAAKRNAAVAKQVRKSDVPEPFDVLPPAVLAQLSKDQAALQQAAQREAFTAPIGETIYWENEGRTGSAMAEDETSLGGFICRTFVQTVAISDSEERASTLGCKNSDGVWQASLNRREISP